MWSGVLSEEKFKEIQSEINKSTDTILYREKPSFYRPKKKRIGS